MQTGAAGGQPAGTDVLVDVVVVVDVPPPTGDPVQPAAAKIPTVMPAAAAVFSHLI
ncbi:hypothetical protein [Dermatobacter hominis]|uniref:hypothetical protein n=1 Tax=Dermatobacter hominis TaxID=2884263 RepID=UPI001D12AF80|nr:hypothetical protein [Dermatobacter hominis]UDY36306.1 hypothetical protein LH044_01935 [Dermatobacter hominis]